MNKLWGKMSLFMMQASINTVGGWHSSCTFPSDMSKFLPQTPTAFSSDQFDILHLQVINPKFHPCIFPFHIAWVIGFCLLVSVSPTSLQNPKHPLMISIYNRLESLSLRTICLILNFSSDIQFSFSFELFWL